MSAQEKTICSQVALEKNAIPLFWIVVGTHFLLWTFLPWFIQPSPATYDVMEMFILGREWVLGSSKHPPLPFWVLEIVYQLTGRATFACYLASQIWVFLGLWAVWRLSREFLSNSLALLVVLSSLTYRYFNLGSISYTTSVPPVSLWCLAITFFYLALRYNRKRFWVLLGITLGAGLLSKYSLALLIVCMLLYLTCFTVERRYWKTAGPYLTTMTAFLVFLPHLVWMFQNDFITLKYAESVVLGNQTWLSHLTSPAKFLFSQIILVLPVLICLIPLTGFAWQLRFVRLNGATSLRDEDQNRRGQREKDGRIARESHFLTFMIFVPFLLQIIIPVLNGTPLRTAYGSPLWTLLPLWMLTTFKIDVNCKRIKQTVLLTVGVILTTLTCYVLDYQFVYQFYPNEGCRIHFPGPALARSLEKIWQDQCPTSTPSPSWLTGDWKLAGHAAYQMQERPRVLCYYNGLGPGEKPVNFKVGDDEINKNGGMIVWEGDNPNPDWLQKRYPHAVLIEEPLILSWQTRAKCPQLHVRVAVIPPKTVFSGKEPD
ncbi:MAG: glycosyltransferase family 39 protein [Thermoguttaceae bacterium]